MLKISSVYGTEVFSTNKLSLLLASTTTTTTDSLLKVLYSVVLFTMVTNELYNYCKIVNIEL